MSQEQTSNAPTNADSRQSVSFENVSLEYLKSSFNDTYKVSKGSASQLVLGFEAMRNRLQEPTNEYQQTLYPKLKELCDRLYAKYSETFLTTFENDTERQVFGANLNGNRNNGSLYRSIPSGVNRNLTYNYAQFGQLMRVLTNRLRFVVQRDPTSVQRYSENASELSAYQKLQSTTNTFMTFLTDLSNEWNQLVSDTRTRFAIPNQTDGQTQQRQPRTQQDQQSRQPRQQRQQRTTQDQQSRPRRQVQDNEQSQRPSRTQQGQQTNSSRPRTTTTRQRPTTNQGDGEWTTSTHTRVRTRNTATQNRVVV
jgi:hypothetical protein